MLANKDRAQYGRAAVKAGNPDEGEPVRTQVQDTLTNMMHFCSVLGFDLHDVLDIAELHYREEVKEELENPPPAHSFDADVSEVLDSGLGCLEEHLSEYEKGDRKRLERQITAAREALYR